MYITLRNLISISKIKIIQFFISIKIILHRKNDIYIKIYLLCLKILFLLLFIN